MATYDMDINNMMDALRKVEQLPDERFADIMNPETIDRIINQLFIPIKGQNTHLNAEDTKTFFGIQNLNSIEELKQLPYRDIANKAIVFYKARNTTPKSRGALRKSTSCFGHGTENDDGNLNYIDGICEKAGVIRIELKNKSDDNAQSKPKPSKKIKTEQQRESEQAEALKAVEAHQARKSKTVKETSSEPSKSESRTNQEEPVPEKQESVSEFHIYEPLTLNDILETPPLDFLTDNLIVRNTVNVFFAPAKTGKTYGCISYAICMVMDIPFVGMENHLKRNVGYLNLDMFRGGFNDRVKQVIKGFEPNATPEYISNILSRLKIIDREAIRGAGGHIPNFYKEEYLDDLRNFIIINDIEFLFIDTFTRIRGGSVENDNDDMAITLQNMEAFLTPLNCGCLAIHHTGKDGKLRGASAIVDNSEFVFGLRKVNGSNKHLQLFSDTPRYTDVFELDVYPIFKQITNEETGASHADSYFLSLIEADNDSSKVIDYLNSIGNVYTSKRNISYHAGGSYDSNRKEVDSLFAQGQLERVKSGKGFNYRIKKNV